MGTYHIPTILTGIAAHLGHAMCPRKGETPGNLYEWHQAATRAYEARIAECDELRARGLTPVYPSAYWRLDQSETGPVVSYTTTTGRLEIVAVEDGITISVFAGPPETEGLAGRFVREPDGRYRWEQGSQRVPVRALGPAIEWGERPGDGEPGEIVTIRWTDAGAVASGIYRKGRLILVAGIDEGRPFVEWVDPDLVVRENRPDRVGDFLAIDRKVFGGALMAADASGRLAQSREMALLSSAT